MLVCVANVGWVALLLHLSASFCAETYTGKMGIMVRLRGSDGARLGADRDKVAGAALMAVKHVRERNSTLVPDALSLHPNFSLDVDLVDTRSEPLTGVEHAVSFNERGMDIIVGAARSAVSGPVALVSGLTKTPVLSYSSTAAILSTSTYPLFSRVIPNDSLSALSFVMVCKEKGWFNVALLFIDDSYGQGYAQAIHNHAARYGINVVVAPSFSSGENETIEDAVKAVRESGSHVIFCISFNTDIAAIAQAATFEGLVGRGFVWITGDSLTDPAALVASSLESELLLNFLHGFISINTRPLYGEKGEKFARVWAYEKQTVDFEPVNRAAGYVTDMEGDCSDLCGYIYDAVWAASFAVSEAMEYVAGGFTLDKARVNPSLRQLSFRGATGHIAFQPTGDRSPGGITVIYYNWVRNGAGSLSLVDLWEWDADRGQISLGPTPIWSGGLKSETAPPDGLSCEEGFVYSRADLTCIACAPGSHEQEGACVKCEVGKVAPSWGAAACVHCESGYADNEGMTACVPCPPHTQRDSTTLGVNRSECKCVANFFSPNNNADCVPCVPGAICPGRGKMPHPRYGFWGEKDCTEYSGELQCVTDGWLRFYECNPPGMCPGGAEFACREGHTGRMCVEATDKWFVLGGFVHIECGEYGHLVSIFGILGVVATWWMLNKIVSSHYDALDIALLFVQTTGMISGYGFKWHPTVDIFNLILSVANFDVDFVTPHCLFAWSKSYSFFLQLALPLLFSFVVIVRCSAEHIYRLFAGKVEKNWLQHMLNGAQRRFLTAAIVLYHTLCIRCFEVFRCEKFPDGKTYMKFTPEMECWTPVHKTMVGISVIYIVVVILGTPMTIWLVIRWYKRNHRLHCPVAVKQWGFVHVRYEADWKYWETMLVLRRGMVAFLLVSMDSPMLKGAFTMIGLTALLSAHVFTRPYVDSQIDVLDFCSILGSMLYCLAGILSYPSITADTQGVVCTEGGLDNPEECGPELAVKYWISIVTLCAVLLTLVVSALLAWLNVREKRASEKAAKIVYNQVIHRSENLLGDVSETMNKVSLCEILDGRFLISWAKSLRPTEDPTSSQGPAPLAFSMRKTSTSELSDTTESPRRSPKRLPLPRFRRSSVTDNTAPLPRSAVAYVELEKRLRAVPVDLTQYSQETTANIIRRLSDMPGLCDWLSCAREEGKLGLRAFVKEFIEFVEVDCNHCNFPLSEVVQEAYRPLMCYWLLQSEKEGMALFWELMDKILESDNKEPMVLSTISNSNLRGAAGDDENKQDSHGSRAGSRNGSRHVHRLNWPHAHPRHVHPWQQHASEEVEELWDRDGDRIVRRVMDNKTSLATPLKLRLGLHKSYSFPDELSASRSSPVASPACPFTPSDNASTEGGVGRMPVPRMDSVDTARMARLVQGGAETAGIVAGKEQVEEGEGGLMPLGAEGVWSEATELLNSRGKLPSEDVHAGVQCGAVVASTQVLIDLKRGTELGPDGRAGDREQNGGGGEGPRANGEGRGGVGDSSQLQYSMVLPSAEALTTPAELSPLLSARARGPGAREEGGGGGEGGATMEARATVENGTGREAAEIAPFHADSAGSSSQGGMNPPSGNPAAPVLPERTASPILVEGGPELRRGSEFISDWT